MSTVIVNLTFAIVQYAAATSTSGTVISLIAPAGAAAIPPQTVAPGVTTATFDNVPDGAGYTATSQLLDGGSNPLGAVATSEAFDVVTAPPATVGIATPSVITVSVGA